MLRILLFVAHVAARFNVKDEQIYTGNDNATFSLKLLIVPAGIVCAYFYYILKSRKEEDDKGSVVVEQ